ncbi:MAG TPA: aspartate kinase, partial [Nitrospiria bacterium]|nr:aspartate kinase [Nitrospiria bacterium]
DITHRGEEAFHELQQSDTNIHIIGVDSDLFFTASENKETHKQLAQSSSKVTYGEIHSVHGHDAFLIEFEQMKQLLQPVFSPPDPSRALKVLKFGGRSLANGEGIDRVLDIVTGRVSAGERIVLVLSAREKATDQLEELLELASAGKDYREAFDRFEKYQRHTSSRVNFGEAFEELARLLEGVRLLGDYSPKIKDQVLSHGELISARLLTELLIGRGVEARLVDTRQLIKTDSAFGNAQVLEEVSRDLVSRFFASFPAGVLPVVTGFIGSNLQGETTTLGRNGSNYSASLLANFLNADELENYTHVDGIYTANPELVPGAQRIAQLSYGEANELANFGATILHAKTIIPLLEKNIPLRILNTFGAD